MRRKMIGLMWVFFVAFLIGSVGAVETSEISSKSGVKDTGFLVSSVSRQVQDHDGVYPGKIDDSKMQNLSNVKRRERKIRKLVVMNKNLKRELGPVSALISPKDIEKVKREDGSIDKNKLRILIKRRLEKMREKERRIRKIREINKMKKREYEQLAERYGERTRRAVIKRRLLENNLRDMRKEYRECVINKKEEVNGKRCEDIVNNYTLMAKNYLYNAISIAISKLEQIRVRLEESKILNQTQIERGEREINDTIQKLKEFQSKINESTTLKELKEVALNYSQYMSKVKFRAYKALEIERVTRFEFVIERARVLETRMKIAVENANLSEEKREEIEDLIERFDQHISMAEEYREEALSLLRSANRTNWGQVVRKVNQEYLPKMKNELNEAHRILQEIWNKYISKKRYMREIVRGKIPLNQLTA